MWAVLLWHSCQQESVLWIIAGSFHLGLLWPKPQTTLETNQNRHAQISDLGAFKSLMTGTEFLLFRGKQVTGSFWIKCTHEHWIIDVPRKCIYVIQNTWGHSASQQQPRMYSSCSPENTAWFLLQSKSNSRYHMTQSRYLRRKTQRRLK